MNANKSCNLKLNLDLIHRSWKFLFQFIQVQDDQTNDNRNKNNPVVVIQGNEPVQITSIFHGFSRTTEKGGVIDSDEYLGQFNISYTFEQLKNKKSLPNTVDKTRLETYLSDEEFQKIFGMLKDDFEAMPEWKKSNLRKKKKLF